MQEFDKGIGNSLTRIQEGTGARIEVDPNDSLAAHDRQRDPDNTDPGFVVSRKHIASVVTGIAMFISAAAGFMQDTGLINQDDPFAGTTLPSADLVAPAMFKKS